MQEQVGQGQAPDPQQGDEMTMVAEAIEHQRCSSLAVAGSMSLGRMSDEAFQSVVIRQALKRTRNDVDWERLLSPALASRTREALTTALARHLAAVRKRRDEWKQTQGRAMMPRAQYFAARSDYEQQRTRDANFTAALHEAIGQLNDACRRINSDRHQQRRQNTDNGYLTALAELVAAVQQHRAAKQSEDRPPAIEDLQLWSALDGLRIADGNGATMPLHRITMRRHL